MALTETGHAALSAILANDAAFPRVKDADLTAAAIKLARKQIIAAGLTRDDLLHLREAGQPHLHAHEAFAALEAASHARALNGVRVV